MHFMNGAASLSGISIRWSAASDVGRTRAVNEDSVIAKPPIFLVADGMGGHEAGDVASAMAVAAADDMAAVPHLALVDIDEGLRAANTSIYEAGTAAHLARGMGTTAVGLALVDNGGIPAWLVLNVGDSRAYWFGDGRLEQLSTDHSYVQELIEAGAITTEDARHHPDRNVVTRALGVGARLDPDYWLREPTSGERFLLCSDGLTSEVDDVAIAELLADHDDPTAATAALVDRALGSGGKDNITVIVVDVVSVDRVVDDALVDTAPRPTEAAAPGSRARSRRNRRRTDTPAGVAGVHAGTPADRGASTTLIASVPTVDEIVESSPHLLEGLDDEHLDEAPGEPAAHEAADDAGATDGSGDE